MTYKTKFESLEVFQYDSSKSLDSVKDFFSKNDVNPVYFKQAQDMTLVLQITEEDRPIFIFQGMTIAISKDRGVVMGLAPQLLEIFYEET